MHLKRYFPQIIDNKSVVSYGSCQFPTLGFVVERYKAIKEFIAESFWKLVGKDNSNPDVSFNWERGHLFDEEAVKVTNILFFKCLKVFYDLCIKSNIEKVVLVDKHPKSKWRPIAMDTILLEKLGVRKLHMNAKRVMEAAERLYSKGFISYPR